MKDFIIEVVNNCIEVTPVSLEGKSWLNYTILAPMQVPQDTSPAIFVAGEVEQVLTRLLAEGFQLDFRQDFAKSA